MNKPIVRGTEINVRWNPNQDDYPAYSGPSDYNHLGDCKKILTGPEKDDTINTTDARTSEEKNCC